MCILAGTTFAASIASENVIVSTSVVPSSSDETKVGGVLSGGDCANAYPGNGASATKSKICQMSPAGRYDSGFGAATCPGSPACSMAIPPPVTTSVMASMAASANTNKVVLFL